MTKITIPKTARSVGQVPRPREYTFLNVTLYSREQDPRKHFTIGTLRALDHDTFVREGKSHAAHSKDYSKHAFIFVHGFANTFNDGLYRTAQLAYDMNFDGVPYSYSFPSDGSTSKYLYDPDSVDASHAHFLEYLKLVSLNTNVEKIHIIAHSMGARLLVDTLFPANNGRSPIETLPKLSQIVLAAPDVDSSVLRSRSAAIGRTIKPLTLYASDSDEALIVSRALAEANLVLANSWEDYHSLIVE